MCKEKDRKSELVEKWEGKEYAAREKKRKRKRKGTGKRERERDEVEGDRKAERRWERRQLWRENRNQTSAEAKSEITDK